MTFKDAAVCLNQPVRLNDRVHRFSGVFLLTGVMVRKNKDGAFMQAELQDTAQKNAVLIANLNDIESDML